MQTKTLKSDLLLLLAAFFWGTTFVAQRLGIADLSPSPLAKRGHV